jgi:D-arabinose 1-dehydrogenase-like Zn-dependent alcohol dehydrogenase
VPCPREGEALLRVVAASLCHTELQLLDGTLNPGVWPLTPGHEIAGEVLAGPADLVGRVAVVYYSRPCGECEWCADGQEEVCPNSGPQPGLSADGGFAEFVCVPATSLVVLPVGLMAAQAAPLGCAAATAYHALHAIARVGPGETLVVYGVGGVGLPLIQLGAEHGARVLAVGRSAGKLALARRFGAETIDAASVDAALEVRRRTRGQGAHAVFELVASEASMEASLAMLRRRGRLVFVGYGAARLRVNPLELVLREIQVLSSLGNTRAELCEVVRLAAAGRLTVPLAADYALEDVGEALDALRHGRIEGRAVFRPSARASAMRPAPAMGTKRPGEGAESAPGASAVAPAHVVARRVPGQTPIQGRYNAAEHALAQGRLGAATEQTAAVTTSAPSGQGSVRFPLESELMRFVGRGVAAPRHDDEFNALALRLFAYQFANNRPYRLLAEHRGQTPASVSHWRQIPAVPIAAFKETLLAAEPTEHAAEFNSSGTTQPERKSRHFHPSLALYDLNAALNFKAHVLPDRDAMRLLILFPTRQELPSSSLAHWLTLMVERFGSAASDWFVSAATGLDAPRLLAELRATHEPVGLLAASFGLVHFLEYCQAHTARVRLPPGSRVMDTGGYKGRSREYARDDLYALVTETLGVPPTHIVNMYGMTEHGTQFLDAVLHDHLPIPSNAPARYKVVPPWARTRIVHPETLADLPGGERGLLLHVDLINRASAVAVLSEDVGYAAGDGFQLIGRARGSEARGCSIALDELIEAVRGGSR